jgi:Xaa-Pro dipeptidase
MERLFVLVISGRDAKLIVNQLIPVDPIEGIDVIFHTDWDDWVDALASHLGNTGTVGLDTGIPADFAFNLIARKPGVKFVNGSGPINSLRLIKEPEEIELLRTASKLNDKVIEGLIKAISPDLTEKELGRERVKIAESLGVDAGFGGFGGAAYGANAADPHHPTENSRLKPGDNIVMDIGSPYKKYHSDMTRTVFYKEPNARLRKVYDTVLKAQLAAIEVVKPGVPFKDIDAASRKIIEAEGFGEYFIHRVGHCLGLDIHEPPYVSGNNPLPVASGMVFSIEPGIYLPGEGAVRIEDLILVTETGHEVLNYYPKELQIVR